MKRFSALILILLLTLAALPTLAEEWAYADAPVFSDAPRAAYIHSPISASAGICLISDDYEMPQAVYYNGLPVLVHSTEKSRGGYPEALTDPKEQWAFVTIGAKHTEGSIYGWMPLVCLSEQAPTDAPVLPLATAQGIKGKNVPLYQDNGLTDTVLKELIPGTQVEVLGQMKRWYHVRVEGVEGFMRPGDLLMEEASEALLREGQPLWGYDDIAPGHEQRYQEYSTRLRSLYNRYHDVADWPLEARAQASDLALEYGFEYMSIINTRPGPQDLKEDEARSLALRALEEEYGLGEGDILSSSLDFYYLEEDPATRLWDLTVYVGPGLRNSTVTLDTKGNPVAFRQAEAPNVESSAEQELTPEELKALQDTLDFYLMEGSPAYQDEQSMDVTKARELAWAAFAGGDPALKREDHALECAYQWSGRYDLKWWMVRIQNKLPELGGYPSFSVAVVDTDPPRAVPQSSESYEALVRASEHSRETLRLEKERGPLATWTLEQKAAHDPGLFALPGKIDLPQDRAIQIAQQQLQDTLKLPKDVLDTLKPYPFFLVEGTWRIDFYSDAMLKEERLNPYSVFMDGMDGTVLEIWDAREPSNG